MKKEERDGCLSLVFIVFVVAAMFNSCYGESDSSSETSGKSVSEIKMELCRANPSIPDCRTDFPGLYK